MVLNQGDKMKRRGGELVDLVDPLTGSPKRPKVHAQRKFAQGAAALFSSSVSPVKEKEKIKPNMITELITHKRPNTEDFLTFLCFRGTSILPPRLNFFNVDSKKEKSEPKTKSPQVAESARTCTAAKPKAKAATQVKKAIQKNLKFKSTTSAIQALKKKYQEQRLAKQRIRSKLQASSNVMKTRSRGERTPSKPKSSLKEAEVKRHGLRSGGSLRYMRKVGRKVARKSVEDEVTPQKIATRSTNKQPKATWASFSSEEEENSEEEKRSEKLVKVRRSARGENKKKKKKKENKEEKWEMSLAKRVTRSQRDDSKSPCKRRTRGRKNSYVETLEDDLMEEEDSSPTKSPPKVSRGAEKTEARVTRLASKGRMEEATPVKSKRRVSLKRYCEVESEQEESSCVESEESSEEVRPSRTRNAKVSPKPKEKKDVEVKVPELKVSEDEESFKGFPKKVTTKTMVETQKTTPSEQKTPADDWKERLNLSTKRIEKWLSETTLAKEDTSKTTESFEFKSPLGEKRTHLPISSKIQHLVRPVVALSKIGEKGTRVLKQQIPLVEPAKSPPVDVKQSPPTPKKPFQPKLRERKVATPNANAFSPENESSVYAFESDNEATPVSTPFRRKLREGGAGGKSPEEACKDLELPKGFRDLTNVQVLPLDKLSTSWSEVNCSSSIAVQVNLDEQRPEEEEVEEEEEAQEAQRSIEISTQTEGGAGNDDDDNGHLFYIPLQAVTRNGANLAQGQQYIQGVAVKLGTEGPGQRVMLKAKLVTKPSPGVARCPPVGTVQPTSRVPESPVASTSSGSGQQALAPPREIIPVEKGGKASKVGRERKSAGETAKGKRLQGKSKGKNLGSREVASATSFPDMKNPGEKASLVQAPTFRPSEKDFQDPLEYFDKIRPTAEKFGICRVVPPVNFKPDCKVSDDMRFTAYNQYIHRMLHRWGLNVKEMMAIKKYLATQSITLNKPPLIGGMEVDLPHLYQTVQSLGGLKEVIEKKKWQKVADGMKIPRSAQDRVAKLDDIYCKYLLPYDTLSPEEREKLFEEVEIEWKKKESRALQRQECQSNEEDDEEDESSDENEECIVKGRNMPLNAFYRIARNTQRMWFGENQRSGDESEGASAEDVETAFWKHVSERKRHICVHNASIDSSGRGFGFSVAKNSPFARHPWNLKVLTNNVGSVLRALGPLMGVTVPTLHVGMLFSACCWYRDPHGLPWIEYLHTGAKKIWYGIPNEQNDNFREALRKILPRYCKTKTIWLPSDTAMVPPELLVENGVPLCQTVQEPGQFIIVFPKAFTSSICTGYVVSESVYFAQLSWLRNAEQVFKDINDSCEPSIFSFERLLVSIINDAKAQLPVLQQILPSVKAIWKKECKNREQVEKLGLASTEKLPLPENGKRGKGKKVTEDDSDFECEICRANLFLSLVNNNLDNSVYCLSHALSLLRSKKLLAKNCTFMYTYGNEQLQDMIRKLETRIETKSKKSNQTKQGK